MFGNIEIPFGCVMLFNSVKLKPGVSIDDVELLMGEMCNVVKNNYGDDEGGFIGGQVFSNAGFVSEEGSIASGDAATNTGPGFDPGDVAIITYWQSFDQHEKSHADMLFREKFSALGEYCEQSWEIGYEMLWQGLAGD
jgi:hypothetical protein